MCTTRTDREGQKTKSIETDNDKDTTFLSLHQLVSQQNNPIPLFNRSDSFSYRDYDSP